MRGELEELLGIIDHLPAMVAYWGRDCRNRVANRAYVDWFGVTPEALRGMHVRDLLGPELYAANLPYIQGALAGEAQQFQRTLVDATGATRYTQAQYVPDMDAGEVRGFFVLVADVTERVEAELGLSVSSDRYRALVRSIPGGFVLLFDRELRYLVADGNALALFGHTPGGLEGCTLHEALPAATAREVKPHRAALAGRSVSWERELTGRVFRLTAGPVRDGDGDGSINAGMVICTEITEQRRNEATAAALRDVARLVADLASPATVAAAIAHHLSTLFGLEHAAIFRFDPGGTVELLAAEPAATDTNPAPTVDLDGESAVARVFRTGLPATATYGEHTPGIDPLRARGMRAGAAAPIRLRGSVWGAIAVASADPDSADAAMLERLESFADLVQLAVGNAEAWRALTHQATTDAVTGLPNRQWFDQSLAAEIARSERHDRPLSLVLLDLDHFKRVNDIFGHPMGDRVLHELGGRLAGLARRSETVARIGGEEFAWILSETDAQDALRAADQARAAIAGEPFASVGQVTISAGVSSLDAAGSAERLVEQADAALYEAKRAGRNRAVLFGESRPGAVAVGR